MRWGAPATSCAMYERVAERGATEGGQRDRRPHRVLVVKSDGACETEGTSSNVRTAEAFARTALPVYVHRSQSG